MEKPELLQETSRLLRTRPQGGSVRIGNHEYEILPEVFSPATFPSTAYYAEQIPIPKGGSFLEVGTGAGVIAIEAAYRGAAQVYATDINPAAVENARRNVAQHNLGETVIVLQSDVFDGIPKQEFDVIFWSMPFGFVTRHVTDMLERATFDQEYRSIRRYFAQAHRHLAKDGLLLFGFSRAIGSELQLDRILQENHLCKRLLSEQTLQEERPVDFGLYRAINNEKEK